MGRSQLHNISNVNLLTSMALLSLSLRMEDVERYSIEMRKLQEYVIILCMAQGLVILIIL
jgi:hypothetical protein